MFERLRAGVAPWPLTLALAWTLGVFTASTAAIHDLWRPLLSVLALSIVVVMVCALMARRSPNGSLIVGAVWLLALGAWPIAVGIGAVALWRLMVTWMRRRRGRAEPDAPLPNQVIRAANALGVAGIVVAVVALLSSGAVGVRSASAVAHASPPAAAPSIYAILLDGYPATATLREDFSFDNDPFISELVERGFTVATDSRSNYNRTLLTLTSMMYMSYIEDIPALSDPSDPGPGQTRQLTAALNDAPVPKAFRAAGYDIVTIGSTYGEALLTSADEVRRNGALTMFEEQFLRYTAAGNWLIRLQPELIADQHRSGVLRTLEDIEALAADSRSEPMFALAHVFSPHTPFVFAADGGTRPIQACYPRSCGITDAERERLMLSKDAYASGLTGQIEFLNRRLVEIIDAIVAEHPDAVIVLFSDHGARFEEGPDREHFRTFLAARTPGHDGLFPLDVSLVNVFPLLMNAYLGADEPLQAHRSWWASDFDPLRPDPVQ